MAANRCRRTMKRMAPLRQGRILDRIRDSHGVRSGPGCLHLCLRNAGGITTNGSRRCPARCSRRSEAGLAAEGRDADRSRVRVIIRDKLSGMNVPFDIRVFVGTVWRDYLTQLRQAEGTRSDAYGAAVKIMDDMLWSIPRNDARSKGQALGNDSTHRPRPARRRGRGCSAEDKMKCFLSVLYDLHMRRSSPWPPTLGDSRSKRSGARSPAKRKENRESVRFRRRPGLGHVPRVRPGRNARQRCASAGSVPGAPPTYSRAARARW
jgi:hypothetical protein